MILTSSRYIVFNHNDCWILTKEKIASSWLKAQFEFTYIELQINPHTLDVEYIKLPHHDLHVSDEQFSKLKEKFFNDWNNFINGSEENNFIFLIRNPVNKFMTGWVQDRIIAKLNTAFIETEKERLSAYFSVGEVDNFLKFSLEQSNIRNEATPQRIFPEIESLPEIFKDIYEEFCFPRNPVLLEENAKQLIENTITTGHTSQTLYILWKFLFKSKYTKLHVIDIDLEDLEYVLLNKFNLPISPKPNDKYVRLEYMRNKTYRYLSNQYVVINAFLETELFFWFEIISKIYPKSMYDAEKLPMGIKEMSEYKKRYFIPEHFNFFDIETHINWWQYEPEEVSLNYT